MKNKYIKQNKTQKRKKLHKQKNKQRQIRQKGQKRQKRQKRRTFAKKKNRKHKSLKHKSNLHFNKSMKGGSFFDFDIMGSLSDGYNNVFGGLYDYPHDGGYNIPHSVTMHPKLETHLDSDILRSIPDYGFAITK